MHLHTRNVNSAFRDLVSLFDANGEFTRINAGTGEKSKDRVSIVKRPSRNGNVLMLDDTMTVTYSHPRERVLFNSARDANPFFHLYEALWMLAGRNDVASLSYYTSKMAQFSDDGKTFNGAYGYRWRNAADKTTPVAHDCGDTVDQLDILVNHLKADPNSRRAVLAMWNVEDDLLKIGSKCDKCDNGEYIYGNDGHGVVSWDCGCGGKLVNQSKDVCCNLNVMFSIRVNDLGKGHREEFLDMTVTNRSNDMIWGMLGANYVHFTILQEYLAARLGVEVGRYNHFTNNLHVYDWNWKPEEWLKCATAGFDYTNPNLSLFPKVDVRALGRDFTNHIPLVTNVEQFERYLKDFVQYHGDAEFRANEGPLHWGEPFLDNVAQPLFNAFHMWKLGAPEMVQGFLDEVQADDWRIVGTNWMRKRLKGKTDGE